MAKYIEQQLEDQKRLLYLEIPALRNHNSLMKKLRLNLRSESDLSQLDTYEHALHLIGNSPLHRKFHRKLFKRATTISNDKNHVAADVDQRSGVVNDLFPNKSTDNVDFDSGSSESKMHNVSFRTTVTTNGTGYSNPLAYDSYGDLDNGNQSYDDEETDSDYEDERRDYQRRYVIDNEEFFIGAMPSPVSSGPASIAVMIDVYALLCTKLIIIIIHTILLNKKNFLLSML